MNRNTTATILLVLAIGIYFTVTKGFWADAQTVKAVNDQYSTALANAEQLISVREKVLKDYNNLTQEDKDKLDKLLPSTVDNIRLIIDMNSIAVQHGFSLKNIKATASASGQKSAQPSLGAGSITSGTGQNSISTPTLDTVTVSFGVSAPYDKFISYLEDIEANLRIMDLTHLTVTAGDSGTYDYSVELKTYWLRQQ